MPEVLIVGGGIVGCATAMFLARAGVTVALYERAGVASGTSHACEGNILSWDKPSAAEETLALRSQTLWHALADELGPVIEYERKGSLVVADSDQQLEGMEQVADRLRARGQEVERLDARGLRTVEPCLAGDLPGGVLFAADAQLEPRRATQALAERATAEGVAMHRHTPVTRILRSPSGAIEGIETPAGRVEAPHVVVATGIWTPHLLRTCGLDLPIIPRQGQLIVCERAPGLIRRKVQEASYLSAVQADVPDIQVAMVAEATQSGQIQLGSSREEGTETSAAVAVSARIARRAARFIPALARLRVIRTYAGIRPGVPDHRPVIGPVSLAPGLWLATGHEGAGIGLAPATAELITAGMRGTPPDDVAQVLSPDRLVRSCDEIALSAAPGWT